MTVYMLAVCVEASPRTVSLDHKGVYNLVENGQETKVLTSLPHTVSVNLS